MTITTKNYTPWQRLMWRLSNGSGHTLWNTYWHRWHRRATDRAKRISPRYREIRAANETGHGTYRFDHDTWDEENDLFWSVNRRPLYWYVHEWWEDHGFQAQRRRMRQARQRAENGFSTPDTWNLDSYLAEVIAKGVAELRRDAHGHPCDITWEEWEQILIEIEEGFLAYQTVRDIVADPAEQAAAQTKFDRAFDLFREHYESLWD